MQLSSHVPGDMPEVLLKVMGFAVDTGAHAVRRHLLTSRIKRGFEEHLITFG